MERARINRLLVVGMLALVLLSSCGTFTKMRYSRGFKTDFSLNRKSKEAATPVLQAKKAEKKKTYKKPSTTNDNIETIITEIPITENITIDYPTEVNEKTTNNTSEVNIENIAKHQKNIVSEQNSEEKPPVEPNVAAGALFYFLGNFLFLVLGTIYGVGTVIFFGIGLMILIGFILAIIGLRKINRAPKQFRGEGLAIVVIVLFLVSLLLSIFSIMLFLYLL